MLLQLLVGPLAVDHKYAAGLYILNHLHALDHVCGIVASHEVRLVDIVRALDRVIAKTQMGNGDTAGLFGIILEVCLNILVGVVTDNLGGVLVCSNRTVAAETPELALLRACCGCDRRGLDLGKA